MVPMSTLDTWNNEFDKNMRPIIVPDKRGKSGKVTLDMVQKIIEAAEYNKTNNQRIRLKTFTRMLSERMDIFLSAKTVGDILTANNLRSPRTRKKRPAFYQKLRQEIPNGLISIDGSEIIIYINDQVIKLNLEMAVDTNSFAHTAFSIAKTENSEEFITVLTRHCRQWGKPVGLVCDSGSANLSAAGMGFLEQLGIHPVPAGPGNPKGNGTIEGAFSQLKQTIGSIHIDTSSPESLAKSVLQAVISVYIKMRNRIPLTGQVPAPGEYMASPVSEKARMNQKQKLIHQTHQKNDTQDEDSKRELLHYMIKTMGIEADPAVIKRAEKTISFYNMEAVQAARKSFIIAVNRKKGRLNLAYFFGILKRIQQEQDNDVYKKYCRDRYHYQQMQKNQERQSERKPSTMQDVLSILEKAFNAPAKYIREMALRRAGEWINDIMHSTHYTGPLRKKFEKRLSEMSQITLSVKEKIWDYIDTLLKQKTKEKSVTQFS